MTSILHVPQHGGFFLLLRIPCTDFFLIVMNNQPPVEHHMSPEISFQTKVVAEIENTGARPMPSR